MPVYGNENIAWAVEGTIKEGKYDAIHELMKEMCSEVDKEVGSLIYEWFLKDDKHLYVYERYKNADAARIHLKTWEKYQERFFELVDVSKLRLYSTLPKDLDDYFAGAPNLFRMRTMGGFCSSS